MDLRPALEDAIRTLRAGDPLLPVKVVVPNHLLGVWLSRSIFKDTGHMAIDFVLAHELAWEVAAPSLLREGRTRVPENVDLARASRRDPGGRGARRARRSTCGRRRRPRASRPRRCGRSRTWPART